MPGVTGSVSEIPPHPCSAVPLGIGGGFFCPSRRGTSLPRLNRISGLFPAYFVRSIVVPAVIALCVCGRAGAVPAVADQADPALTPEQLKQEEEKAGMDPARLIPLAQRARAEDARRLLHRAMQALTERVDLSAK